ncbi:MAG: hypothetical protein ACHP78_03445 [Terriglobales bacterium]
MKREEKLAQTELEHPDDAISAFGKVVGKAGRRVAAQTKKTVRRVRRKLSAAARKRIAAAQMPVRCSMEKLKLLVVQPEQCYRRRKILWSSAQVFCGQEGNVCPCN